MKTMLYSWQLRNKLVRRLWVDVKIQFQGGAGTSWNTDCPACLCVSQWSGQFILFPGGVSAEGSGSGRTNRHLYHPPTQRQAVRTLRQGAWSNTHTQYLNSASEKKGQDVHSGGYYKIQICDVLGDHLLRTTQQFKPPSHDPRLPLIVPAQGHFMGHVLIQKH